MALNHTSNTSKNEPSWTEVDQNRLPRNAAADMGEVTDPSTWHHKHHFVLNGVIGPSGIYIKGQQFLHEGRLKALLSNKEGMSTSVKDHLKAHGEAVGLIKKKAQSIIHGTTKSQTEHTETKALSVSHSAISDYSLRGIAEAIQSCESLEALKAIEDNCLLHFAQVKQSGKNWLEKEKAEGMSRQITQLCSHRRRQIMSQPSQRALDDYALGRQLGKIQ